MGDMKKELTATEVKAMRTKLCGMLLEQAGGVDQFADLRSMAKKCGINVTKLFRGNDFVLNNVAGRYEVWVEIPEWSSSKDGKGNSLGDAVKDAVSRFLYMNDVQK